MLRMRPTTIHSRRSGTNGGGGSKLTSSSTIKSGRKQFVYNDVENDVENVGAHVRRRKGKGGLGSRKSGLKIASASTLNRGNGKMKSVRKPLGSRNTNILIDVTNRGGGGGGGPVKASLNGRKHILASTSLKKPKVSASATVDVPPIEYVHRPKGRQQSYVGDFDDLDDPMKIVTTAFGKSKRTKSHSFDRIAMEPIDDDEEDECVDTFDLGFDDPSDLVLPWDE